MNMRSKLLSGILNDREWTVHKFQKYHVYIISDDDIIDTKDTDTREKNEYSSYGQ